MGRHRKLEDWPHQRRKGIANLTRRFLFIYWATMAARMISLAPSHSA